MSIFQTYQHEPIVSLEQTIQPLINIVPDIEQMYDVIKEHISQYDDEYGSILLYRLKWKPIESSFQFILNETLRLQNDDVLHPWFPYIRLFLTALSKLPTLSYHTIYRGMKMELTDDYSKDEIFTWLTFTSCQLSIEAVNNLFPENQARVIFIIESYSAKDISEYSLEDNDNEIILYPKRQFQVLSTMNYGNQLKLIQVKEIQQQQQQQINQPQITSSNTFQLNPSLESLINQYPNKSKIDLIEQNLTDKDMDIIVQHAIINKQCEKLFLSYNMFTSKSLAILAEGLNNNQTLKYLRLSYNRLFDQGIKYLTEVLSFNNCVLNTLSLHKVGLTDQGLEYICEMLETNTSLSWLHLGNNKITDRGISILTDVLIHHNKTVKVLELSHNELITDASANCLMDMIQHNQSIETLWINWCNISFEKQKKLKKMAKTNGRYLLIFV